MQKHRDDPDLLLALGLICQRLSFWGRPGTISQRLLPCTLHGAISLAEVLEKMGESSASADTYRRGLVAAHSVAGSETGQG